MPNIYWCILTWFYTITNFIAKGESTLYGGHFGHFHNVYIKHTSAKHVITTMALGSQPKQVHGKVQAESVTWESHSHFRECEKVWKMSPHISKWTPTLRVRVLMESQIFKKQFKGSKLIGLKISLYHWIF